MSCYYLLESSILGSFYIKEFSKHKGKFAKLSNILFFRVRIPSFTFIFSTTYGRGLFIEMIFSSKSVDKRPPPSGGGSWSPSVIFKICIMIKNPPLEEWGFEKNLYSRSGHAPRSPLKKKLSCKSKTYVCEKN